MLLEYDQICTWNSEVETGEIYLYTEGKLECKVKVVQLLLDQEGIHLQLQVVAFPRNSPLVKGEKFMVSASRTMVDTSSWWHLHDKNLVHFPEESFSKKKWLSRKTKVFQANHALKKIIALKSNLGMFKN